MVSRFIVLFISFIIFNSTAFALSAEAEVQTFPLKAPMRQEWSFSGPFGLFDKPQLRRGFKIYRESCAACHGLQYVRFSDLKAIGFSKEQLSEIAKSFQIADGVDQTGVPLFRSARMGDYIPSPFLTEEQAALANNGALPPDLSLMARARAAPSKGISFLADFATNYNEAGADYIASFLQGYKTNTKAQGLPTGQYYNPYYLDGESLAMPPPLQDKQIHYDDGSPESLEQYAQDVAAFLVWAADPHMEKRKQIGFCVLLFLMAFATLIYLLKREIFKTLDQQ